MQKNWTESEITYLTQNYATKQIKQIAFDLNRSFASVDGMIRRLGLRKTGATGERYITFNKEKSLFLVRIKGEKSKFFVHLEHAIVRRDKLLSKKKR
jgi:hypothetical protein